MSRTSVRAGRARGAPRSRGLTAEEFAALPIEGPADLVEGVVVPRSPTGRSHGRVVVRCAELLARHVRERGLALEVVAGDVGFVLRRSPDSVRGADVAVVARPRAGSRDDDDRFVEGPPALAVEVRSPNHRPGEAERKIAEYLAAGAVVVWDLDPGKGTLTVHRRGRRPRTLRGDAAADAKPVLPGFAEPVRALLGE